jgi:flagellar motor protein MotB
MDPSYGEPDYLDDGLIQEQDLPYDDEDDEKLDETFGDDLPVGRDWKPDEGKVAEFENFFQKEGLQSGESKPMKEPSFFPFGTSNNNIEDLRKEKKSGFFPFSTPNPSKLTSFLAENRGMKNQREQLGEEDDERNDDTFGEFDDENEEETLRLDQQLSKTLGSLVLDDDTTSNPRPAQPRYPPNFSMAPPGLNKPGLPSMPPGVQGSPARQEGRRVFSLEELEAKMTNSPKPAQPQSNMPQPPPGLGVAPNANPQMPMPMGISPIIMQQLMQFPPHVQQQYLQQLMHQQQEMMARMKMNPGMNAPPGMVLPPNMMPPGVLPPNNAPNMTPAFLQQMAQAQQGQQGQQVQHQPNQHQQPKPQPQQPSPAQQAQSHAQVQHAQAQKLQQQQATQNQQANKEPLTKAEQQAAEAKEDQDNNQKRRKGSFIRRRWNIGRELMTAEEIDSIIRMQEQQLNFENPFLDDYYYQNTLMRKDNSAATKLIYHRPICEALTRAPPKKTTIDFQGVLGRIPTHSVRAPRPILQLEEEKSGDAEQVENESQKPRAISTRTTPVGSNHYYLLAIEDIYNIVLEIEDLDTIIRHISADSRDQFFNKNGLLEKRKEKTEALYQLLSVHIPAPGPLHPSSNSSSYYCSEDEFLMRVTTIPKGSTLLGRALQVLFPPHLLTILFQYMRNLSVLLSTPKSEEDEVRLKRVFEFIVVAINNFPHAQVLIAFQSLLAAHPAPKFIKIAKSKFGVAILAAFLKKGYEVLRISMTNPQSANDLMPSWRHLFSLFFEQLSGKASGLLAGDITVGYTNKASTNQIWELFTIIAVNSAPNQKSDLLRELTPIIKSIDVTPQIKNFLHALGIQGQ